ncbi:MAG: M4 family metallopeptidase [Kiritimatiellia bacterium]
MKFIAPLHVRNPLSATRPIIRRGLLLSALGAFLLAGTVGLAAQPQANMAATVLSAAPQPVRAATAVQRKLAAAAVAENVRIEWNVGLGTPSSIRGKDLGARQTFSAGKGLQTAQSAQPEVKAIAVLDNLSGIMGIREAQKEFAAKKAQGDNLGFRHVRADQIYQGLKVFGGEVIVHFNQAGAAYQVNGRYVPDIAVDAIPALAPAEALTLAVEDLTELGHNGAATLSAPELVVFAYQSVPRLAYALTLTANPQEANAWRYWIDAQDGTVLMRYNDVKLADISGAILTGEGGATKTVTNCFSMGITNYLESMSWPWLIYNISTNSALYTDAGYIAFRTNTNWGTSDRTEMSAAYNFDLIQKYYWNVHGRQSYDDENDTIFAFVHYEDPYWANNAAWMGWGLILIGEGDGFTASSLAVLDICGHEFTHGVTEYSANLVYAYESGALNESFSDIFGASIEFNSQPDGRANYPNRVAGAADWLIGEDCWLVHTALRDMRCPSNTTTVGIGNEQPSRYKGTYWYKGTGDNGGVHQNDSVQNFFFYLLSEGGSGINEGHAYNVTGIGVTNAAQIAYRTLTVYCYPYTDYTDIRDAWISAAQDLNPTWVASVVQASEAVGIGYGTPDTVANLGAALNAPYLTWHTDSNASWYGQSLITNTIPVAAQSGLISSNSYSQLSTTVTGPGTFSFWWKVWSEQNYDYLRFYTNDIKQMQISGDPGWAKISFTVGAGTYTLKWIYTKDESVSIGLDAGWVAEVAWAPVWTPVVPAIAATSGSFADRIRITWPAMSGATSYRIYRSVTANSGDASLLAEPSGALYDDTTAMPGTVYYYWMQGVNCATLAPWSGSASGYRALAPPAGFSVSKGDYTGSVRLRWTAAAGAISYQIMRNTVNTIPATALVETGATSYNDTTAVPGVTYYYWLRSRKWQGAGDPLQSAFSAGDYGWRRSMASTDSAFCDFDGDGKADPAVYQSASGRWTVMMSGNRYRTATFELGGAGFRPVPQDFDGDGKTDIAVYSQAAGQWLILLSASGHSLAMASIGGPGFIPLPRDYDGDGKADPAVFEQYSGLWKMPFSSRGYALVEGYFGDSAYSPCPADYDDDGKTDPAIFQVRAALLGKTGYLLATESAGSYAIHSWTIGSSGRTVPQDYDGDAKADPALFDANTGLWSYWPSSMISTIPVSGFIGGAGFVPVAGDYDGDRKADPAVYQESTGTWIISLSGSNYAPATAVFGGAGYEAPAAFP